MNSVLSLSDMIQIVNINSALVNFRASFSVFSQTNQPFEMAITTQEFADSENEIPWQTVEKPLDGEIEQTDGIFKDYILLLRSATPDNKVQVDIRVEPLELAAPPRPSVGGLPEWLTLKNALIVSALAAFGVLAYRYYSASKAKKQTPLASEIIPKQDLAMESQSLLDKLKSMSDSS